MTCRKCGGTRQGGRCLLCEMFVAQAAPGGTPPSGWPLVSDALAVHPDQIEQATARNRRHGVNVTYEPASGRAVIPDRGERRRLLRLEGCHDNQGGYGD